MKRILYWADRLAVALAIGSAVLHLVNENYSAAVAWFCVALWAFSAIMWHSHCDHWRKKYLNTLGIDEDEA